MAETFELNKIARFQQVDPPAVIATGDVGIRITLDPVETQEPTPLNGIATPLPTGADAMDVAEPTEGAGRQNAARVASWRDRLAIHPAGGTAGHRQLVRYGNAKKALAELVTFDEVKEIQNKAVAMEVYARQAKDGELIAHATEVRLRAERRLGELMADLRDTGKLAKNRPGPGRGKKARSAGDPAFPTLADQGIDKHLADRARKAAAMSGEKFEAKVARSQKLAVAVTENNTAVIKAARAERHEQRVEQRAERERKLGARIEALPDKQYGVILADPEWKFETWTPAGLDNSSPDNHYTTSGLDVIKARDVPKIAHKDCVLFLWATVPMTPHALEVMAAWGFRYVSHFAWVKDRTGTGYWSFNKHELLLIGVKGKPPAPAEGSQWPSVIEAPVGEHSAKPERSLEMIEAYYPSLPKIELNRRGPARPGWDAWGNEAAQAQAAGNAVDPARSAEQRKAEAAADNGVDRKASADAPKTAAAYEKVSAIIEPQTMAQADAKLAENYPPPRADDPLTIPGFLRRDVGAPT
jgi:N6-adenosine-specific RNA methylase IME4